MKYQQNPMYVIGMICRHVWPSPEKIPNKILNTIITQPLTGLALIRLSQAAQDCEQDILTNLVSRLPFNLSNPSGGIKIEDQGPFWIGYNDFPDEIDHTAKLSSDDLIRYRTETPAKRKITCKSCLFIDCSRNAENVICEQYCYEPGTDEWET